MARAIQPARSVQPDRLDHLRRTMLLPWSHWVDHPLRTQSEQLSSVTSTHRSVIRILGLIDLLRLSR